MSWHFAEGLKILSALFIFGFHFFPSMKFTLDHFEISTILPFQSLQLKLCWSYSIFCFFCSLWTLSTLWNTRNWWVEIEKSIFLSTIQIIIILTKAVTLMMICTRSNIHIIVVHFSTETSKFSKSLQLKSLSHQQWSKNTIPSK